MKTPVSRSALRVALSACAAVALAVPMTATAAEPQLLADLHVEAGGGALAPGLTFQTGTTSVVTDTSQPACGGSGKAKTIKGATALGTLIDAAGVTPALQPLRISDKFSFGLLVCGVGRSVANDDSFWLYKVNHVAPEVAADQQAVKSGDEVLWYFSDTVSGRNTGDELAISAPARAEAGSPVRVRVYSYDAKGVRKPAAGAEVAFGGTEVATADAAGLATVRRDEAGEMRLRAGRGNDIPSPVVRVCVAEELKGCSPVRGRRIFGTLDADVLRGTKGPDVLKTFGGNDRVDVRGGRSDVVRCGRGRDRVRASKADRVARDCEIVNGEARRGRG